MSGEKNTEIMEKKNSEVTEEKKKSAPRVVKELPMYDDIRDRFDHSDDQIKGMLMELLVRRALSEDRQLKKRLGQVYDNRRNDDGTITHLIGFYSEGVMSEREADDMIVSGAIDIQKMWVMDKYSETAELLK